jgi:SAM-dependent methyltransferase
MDPITKFIKKFSTQAREKRADIFKNHFSIDENSKILDIGSESGSNINAVLKGTRAQHKNIYIADINPEEVKEGSKKYGFIPVIISESETLPFEDKFFDIVYCSSVIEHVTVQKDKVWKLYSGYKFKRESLRRQKDFAKEVKRLGKQYFVQTPYKHFPIESHTWLPFIAWLPRWLQITTLHISNHFWVKKTTPDWYLLNKKEMREMFQDAEIIEEKVFGIVKSIMAVKTTNQIITNAGNKPATQ